MNLDFLKFGEKKEIAPIPEAPRVEKEKKVIEPNKRQQDKLVASLLAGNLEAMSKDDVEVSVDERDSFLMKLVSGEITQDKFDQIILALRLPIKTTDPEKFWHDLSATVGGDVKLRNLVFNASLGRAGLNTLANPLNDLARLTPLPGQAQAALEKVSTDQDDFATENFLKGFYGKRFEYYQQSEALKMEALERFSNQEEE
jgi:hypothetical protein